MLNGDKKTEVVPVFNVMLVLEKTNRVELKPTVQVSALLIRYTQQQFSMCVGSAADVAPLASARML